MQGVVISEQRFSFVGETGPLSTFHLPLITYHLLLITYHLPLTTYHLPLITYHLPLITYHLPLTTYHLQWDVGQASRDIATLADQHGRSGAWGNPDRCFWSES